MKNKTDRRWRCKWYGGS